jgi:predicted flap endonuclease-1-like 5' DNA nuclease
VRKVEKKLAFPGRIVREKWVAQAKALVKQQG